MRRAHELAPQCAWTYSWAAGWGWAYLCGLPTERHRWVIPAAIPSHSKRLTTGWPFKPLSGICLILAFCLHLSSAPRLKGAALPLFASLLGSEENDNNEAWRLSTASHTNIHTFNTRNTDVTTNCRHTHTLLQHPHSLTHCEMNAGSHKLLLVPCWVCKYKFVWVFFFICNSLCKVFTKYFISCLCFICYNNSVGLIEKIFYIAESVFVLFLFIFNPSA